ncbi:NAD(P)-dependent oxidoreductase [Mangrovibacter yixingensis]|uniref:NAD(P)-dependent oxidoreductase n=1 Tax=Mangrovibacter yixingensis TaxID=1529639 RepID=UPI001CFBADF9|nr:NAD(P)-dependent oxidoreductase [Mangrovibacter yixingensis]
MNKHAPLGIDLAGVQAGRLAPADYAREFADCEAPLTAHQAVTEADRCHYCYDAPCSQACPADIDVPGFIHRVAQNNTRGAAELILSANVLGGICSRVCPTENLCQQACVRNAQDGKPLNIALLQRFATDQFFADGGKPLFIRAPATGKRVAVVGAGPAGLTVAHQLAVAGHEVDMFDASPKAGGLNEYGLARYKVGEDFASKEVAWLLSVGGIHFHPQTRLGQDVHLNTLREEYDAVFLGLGLAAVNSVSLGSAEPAGVMDAVDFIARLRQSTDLSQLPVGRNVVVIGGGMTAIDAAVQAKKLGARDVTLVYRRGAESMKASPKEQAFAKDNGVTLRYWSAPLAYEQQNNQVTGVTFSVVTLSDTGLVDSGEHYTLTADWVLKAVGQTYDPAPAGAAITLKQGRILTNEQGQTSLPGVWAGGDCCFGGLDLTVDAVRQGKIAAGSIAQALSVSSSHADFAGEHVHG